LYTAQMACHIRDVAYLLPCIPCDRCHQPAQRFSTVARTAVDVDLDQPVLLSVTVSVHHCPPCRHYFRAQPPFLQVDATYSQRVVQKAIDAVHSDGLAFRRVPERLARDFWVSPSESMIRRWCRTHQATLDFAADYQQWVVSEFSGILCVDEVYQDQMALLLAVDPVAPDGDRLVGYQLVHGSVDTTVMDTFLTHLKEVGIQPEQVISDGSTLYPPVLAKVWPTAAHQLCLFHETRHVTKAAMQVIQTARATLPTPPPQPGRGWRGPLHEQPPTANPQDPAYQRWQARRAARQAGIAQVHALMHQGWSQRAIVRQLGISRQTVRKWQKLDPPTNVPADMSAVWNSPKPPTADALRHAAVRAKREQIKALAGQGLSYSAIARHVGLHRVTVKKWLLQDLPTEQRREPGREQTLSDVAVTLPDMLAGQADKTGTEQPNGLSQIGSNAKSLLAAAPPVPWKSWEQVSAIREALHKDRFLLLRRPEHLTNDEQIQVTAFLDSPVPQLRLARTFLVEWYLLWKDEQGRRRTVDDARVRYDAWRSQAAYRAEPVFRRVLGEMTDAKFEHLSAFLRDPQWEATNNGSERAGRAFRHTQASHFNLRSEDSIDGTLVTRAYQCKTRAMNPVPQQASRATRGRKRRSVSPG
jgi:transposase